MTKKKKTKGPAWPETKIPHQKKPSEMPMSTDGQVPGPPVKVVVGDQSPGHVLLPKKPPSETPTAVDQPQAEEPAVDVVGAVESDEKLLKPYPVEPVAFLMSVETKDVICYECNATQQFRGDYEKSQVIDKGFAGWKCTNPSCPTHAPK